MVRVIKVLCVVLVCFWGQSAFAATPGSHYPFGVEGVLGASTPPPGLHYRMYNVFYNPTTLTGNDGEALPIDFELDVFASAQRFVYATDKKILGGDYLFNVIIPLVDKSVSVGGTTIGDESLSLGDITIEPIVLSWHKPRWDFAAALAVVVPSGDYDMANPASVGNGYWSGMLTLGATYFFDEQKTWSLSALTRTLVNTEQDGTNITPGSEFVVEYGLGKEIKTGNFMIRPGLTGYAYWQITEDSGDNADDLKKQSFAVGAELNVFYLPWLLQANLRYVDEFNVENNTEGEMIVFTLTKSF